jgi:hypothetical protein
MQASEAHQLAAQILTELANFEELTLGASWPDTLWPSVVAEDREDGRGQTPPATALS